LLYVDRMSLSKYAGRLVVHRPDTRAYDSVRAMQDNHVGAVIVHDGKQVVGVVTDRDIAMRVIIGDLDPFEVKLSQIMSTPAAVVQVSAAEAEAAALMLERHVRRLPVVDGDELVGLITLDDMILGQTVAPATLAAIVQAQLSAPARLKPEGDTHPVHPKVDPEQRRTRAEHRHAARASLAYGELLGRTLATARLESRERTAAALEEVLFQLLRRITPDEARQLLAQLPSLLQERLTSASTGPDRSITCTTLEQAVTDRLDVPPARARAIVLGVCEALAATISAGELENLRSQLPTDMKDLLPTVPVE
jgi:uncharacterized protein (DUF2267 family)